MQMKILLLNNDPSDSTHSVHIISNKQATYICPLHCKENENIYGKLVELISSHYFHHKAWEKWYDTGDFDWFDFTLLSINTYD